MADAISYELDITGTNPANLITREPHFITEIDLRTQNVLVPNFPPFLPNDFLIETKDDNDVYTPWTLNVDYELSLPWYSLEKETGAWAYGGVTVHRKPTEAQVFITYRTIGKPYIGDRRKVLEALANYVWQPRIVQWDQITNVQETFPPNLHKQNLEQFTRWNSVSDQIGKLVEAMGQSPEPTLLFQQQVLFIRTAYDELLRRVGNQESEIEMLKLSIEELKIMINQSRSV